MNEEESLDYDRKANCQTAICLFFEDDLLTCPNVRKTKMIAIFGGLEALGLQIHKRDCGTRNRSPEKFWDF